MHDRKATGDPMAGVLARSGWLVVLALAVVSLWGLSSARADMPGTDGGPADRGCAPVIDRRYYVGASGRVSCGLARRVAAASIRGRSLSRWRCTGRRTGFGHCHGHGVRRDSTVHWAVND